MRIRVTKAVTIEDDDLEYIKALLSCDEGAVDSALDDGHAHHVVRWTFTDRGLFGPQHKGHYYSDRKVDGNETVQVDSE
jgi:hypothetical protein